MIRRSSKTSADSELECQWGLEAGTHTFNVCFQLPNNGLYTSFDAKNSPTSVRYVIEVKISLIFNIYLNYIVPIPISVIINFI